MMLCILYSLLCCIHVSHQLFAPLPATLHAVYNMIESIKQQQPTALSFPAVRDAVDWGSMLVLDVRETHDVLNHGKIPESHNIPVKKIRTAFRLSDDHFKTQYDFDKPNKDSNNLLIVGDGAVDGREGIFELRTLGYWNAAWYPGGFQEWSRRGGKIKKDLPGAVNYTEVSEGMKAGKFLLVDIRLPVARSIFGIIPNSVNIPVTEIPGIFYKTDQQFEQILGFKKPSRNGEKTIIILGAEGTSGEEVAEELSKLGYTKLKIYPDGFSDWKKHGGAVAYPKPKEVVFADVQRALKRDGVFVIDVRERRELRDKGRLPGSYNVPLSEIPLAFLNTPENFKLHYGFEIPPTPGDNMIITGGSSNRRGRAALQRLRTIGYTTIRLYDGSFSDWVRNGGELIKESTQTTTASYRVV